MEAVTAQCAKHHFDPAVAVCGQCGLTFCPACLVYAFGPDRPPFCIPCALTVGGVRRAGVVPKVPWRERRARRKALAHQKDAEAEAILGAALAEANGPGAETHAWRQPEPVAPPANDHEIDWSAPFESTAFAE